MPPLPDHSLSTAKKSPWEALTRQLAIAVLVIGVACAGLLASREAENARSLEQQRFARTADSVRREFAVSLREHLFALEGIRATFLASDTVDAEEFGVLAGALELDERFPAVGAVGTFRVIEQSPVHVHFDHFAKSQLGDFDRVELERSSEVAAAVSRLLPGTRPATSAPFELGGEPYILWIDPIVDPREAQSGTAEPATEWLYAAISTPTLLSRLKRRCDHSADYQVFDVRNGIMLTEPLPDSQLGKGINKVRNVAFEGLRWRIRMARSASFLFEPSHARTTFVIGSSLAIAVAILLRVLTDARGRAARLAERRTIELAQRESELREEAERKELALAGGGLGLWDWHVRDNWVVYDPRTMEIIGEEVDSLPPTVEGFKARVHPDDVDQLFEKVQHHFDNPSSTYSADFRMIHRDGSHRWVHSRGRVTERAANGEVLRMTGTHIDVTETRRLERELAQSRKLESIGQLATGIAHEINTPMQAVSSNLEFAANSYDLVFKLVADLCETFDAPDRSWENRREAVQRLLKESRYEWLKTHAPDAVADAADASRRVVEIVRAMRAMSHPGQNEKSASDVNGIVRNATTISCNRWKYCAELEHDLAADVPVIPVLEAQLSQVLLNLIVNAADAIAEKFNEDESLGRIVVRTRLEPDALRIEVQDNGPGVPESIRNRLFDPFFTTKEVGKGTGQGLSIAYDVVVNRHGGTIAVDSTEGEGATFTVRLPLVEPSAIEESAEAPDAIEASSATV